MRLLITIFNVTKNYSSLAVSKWIESQETWDPMTPYAKYMRHVFPTVWQHEGRVTQLTTRSKLYGIYPNLQPEIDLTHDPHIACGIQCGMR